MVTPVPVKLSWGPFHGRFFHLISISMENCFKCKSIVGYHITNKFCTCHASTVVVRCAKFYNDHFSVTGMRGKLIFHRIWITMEIGSLTNMGEIYHFSDVTMSVMASLITGVSIVYSSVCSGADQRKHQSSTSLAFVRGIHRWLVNSQQHKGQLTRMMFPFDDVIMQRTAKRVHILCLRYHAPRRDGLPIQLLVPYIYGANI